MLTLIVDILVLIVVCFHFIEANSKAPFLDRPTGPCEPTCSCQMDGMYFSEGEQWRTPDDPCKVYQCSQQGVIQTVETGCWFKNECKTVNDTWVEGCSKFTCLDDSITASYKLIETGCSLPSGECLGVGKRLMTECDVVECQINNGNLKINKIRTGCPVDGSCKPVDSYWHDGCQIYTCTKHDNILTIQTVPNDIMMWPEGYYGLLKAGTGCPTDVPELWSEGSVTNINAILSSSPVLAGNYTDTFIQLAFCVHDTKNTTTALPKYKTYWEPGNYCILRRKGKCPRGFSDGSLIFSDVSKNTTERSSAGVLPDLPTDVGFYFCCRKDGDVSSEIVLPKDENFVLFMGNGETQCQKVRGMTHSMGNITFSGNSETLPRQHGTIPYSTTLNDDSTVGLCLYERMHCGCTDASGHFVALNDTQELNCVTRQCVSTGGMNILKIVSGGCPWMDSCKAANSSWEHQCTTYRCDVKTEDGVYQWNVQPVSYGCVWKDVCKELNATWHVGCHDYTCHWIHHPTGLTALVKATNISCFWNNSCYKEDALWSDGCIEYKCVVNRQEDMINWSVQTARLACKDFSGKCLPVGGEIQDNCITYKCTSMADKIGLQVVSLGCDWNNTCLTVGSRWKDTEKCVEYECQKTEAATGSVMQVSVVGYGCMFNNSCKEVNSTWQDGCRTRKCIAKEVNKVIQRSIAPIAAGCDDEGVCRPVGYKKVTDTCMEYQCVFNKTFKDAFFSLVQGNCRSNNGTCYTVGTLWTEVQATTCVVYECRKEKLGFLSKAIQQKCLDSSGVCREVGASGFAAVVNGKERQNCSCVPSTSKLSSIAFSCKD